MVDCGGDDPETAADIASQYLLSQGISRLDALLLTHYDQDHAGGVPALLSRIPAQTVYLPVDSEKSALQQTVTAAAGENAVWIGEDTALSMAGGGIKLYPAAADATERSMCILFQLGNYDILITGDRDLAGERQLVETAALPDIEILVAGHHGSKQATSLELLHSTMPEVVVISVSKDNSYGHPAQELLDRLKLFQCEVYRTDLYGTITFRG